MKKFEIVKENKEFNDIIHTGSYLKNKYYYIYYKVSDNSYPMFGLAVSTKIGNAVTRNKIKRRLRMIIDNNKKEFSKSYKYIIIVRKGIEKISFNEIEETLISLIKRGNYNEKI